MMRNVFFIILFFSFLNLNGQDLVINAGVEFKITNVKVISELSVKNSGILVNNGQLFFQKNFENQGAYFSNGYEEAFGPFKQFLSGYFVRDSSFNHLTIGKEREQYLELNSNVFLIEGLNIKKGIIKTNNYKLSLLNSDTSALRFNTASGEFDGYVDGYLERSLIGQQKYYYPVGHKAVGAQLFVVKPLLSSVNELVTIKFNSLINDKTFFSCDKELTPYFGEWNIDGASFAANITMLPSDHKLFSYILADQIYSNACKGFTDYTLLNKPLSSKYSILIPSDAKRGKPKLALKYIQKASNGLFFLSQFWINRLSKNNNL